MVDIKVGPTDCDADRNMREISSHLMKAKLSVY